MRLAIATTQGSVIGGAQSYLQTVIPALIERGHEIAVVHEAPRLPDMATIDPLDGDLARWCVSEQGIDVVLRAVESWRPNLVYMQGLQSTDLEQCLVTRYPAVLYAHAYYGTCATGTKRHAFPTPRVCSRRISPACLALHYPRRCDGLDPRLMLRTYRAQRRRFHLLQRYRAILVTSEHMHAEYARHGIMRDRLHLAPYPPTGVTPATEPPSRRPLTGQIVFAGRLTALKGGHYLLEAVRQARRALDRVLSLTVLGAGPERTRLERLARRLDVPVDFAGWCDAERRNAYFRAADIIAVPSLWPEPYGLVGLEAACLGLPAVGYAVGGIPDWLTPGVTGELAPGDPPTPNGLAAAIVRALSSAEHHAALRRGAWEHSHRTTMQDHLAKVESVFDRILRRTEGRS